MLFGSEPNQFTDLALFLMIFFNLFLGWVVGYLEGMLSAHQHMTSLMPIINVSQEETSDGYSTFTNMLDNTLIDQGPTELTIDKITKRYSTQKIIFLQSKNIEYIENPDDTV